MINHYAVNGMCASCFGLKFRNPIVVMIIPYLLNAYVFWTK
jgi:hypothetical protein